nr:CDP-diacylglycerol--serine O-phosphatidyltransferase [Heyndrickxia coagulans]
MAVGRFAGVDFDHWYDAFLNFIKSQAANGLTMANGCCGAAALFYCGNHQPAVSAALIFAAVLFDRYDGKLARKLKTESALGKQLDSLCDLLSFGATPAMLIHTALFCLYGVPGMLAAIFYMLCGMIRLARFNISKQEGFFYGLPIPVAGLCVTAGFFAVPYVTHFWLFVWMVLLSVLMVAPFKLKKI